MSAAKRAAPLIAAILGIALFTFMDAVMKGLALEIGAYRAMVWRTVIGVGAAGVVLPWARPAWPDRSLRMLHVKRGGVNAISAVGYFFGLTRLPMAEGIALAFIAPLVALYLAAVLLKERIDARTMLASLLGVVGVSVLLAARMTGALDARALVGAAAILAAAVVYGYGLILLRQQAQRANAAEVAFFQTATTLVWLLPAAPFLAPLPPLAFWPRLAAGAVLAQMSMMLLAWAYARAEAKTLIPVEYTGFLWAAIFGALMFGETLSISTIAGAMLIVAGCVAAASVRASAPLAGEIGQ